MSKKVKWSEAAGSYEPPIVGSLFSWKSLFTKRRTSEDCSSGRSRLAPPGPRTPKHHARAGRTFPTAASPSKTSLTLLLGFGAAAGSAMASRNFQNPLAAMSARDKRLPACSRAAADGEPSPCRQVACNVSRKPGCGCKCAVTAGSDDQARWTTGVRTGQAGEQRAVRPKVRSM